MKKAYIIVLMVFSAFSAFAADESKLDKFVNLKTLTADFVQTNHYAGLDEFSREGKVYVVRPERALWDYAEPREFYLLRPGRVSHYSEELEQLINIKVDPSRADDPSGLILSIFLDGSMVHSRFKVEEKGNEVLLTPRGAIGVERVTLAFDGDVIKSVYSADTEGNSILIEFSNVVTGKDVPMSVFDKTLPPDTSVYEQ